MNINIDNFLKTLITVLLGIVSFFAVNTYNKLITIEKDLVSLKIQIQRLESERITPERVHDIARYELNNWVNAHPYFLKNDK